MSDLKGSVEVIEPTAAERAIARRAAEARATVPDLELSIEVEAGPELSAADLVRASALALREHPRANGAYRDGRYELYSRVNCGIVTGSGGIATVLDADQKTLAELSAEIDELERRARTLSAAERSGATYTLARYEVTRASALISPPHAIALAAGEVRHGALCVTVACDQRIVAGAEAASVLIRIRIAARTRHGLM